MDYDANKNTMQMHSSFQIFTKIQKIEQETTFKKLVNAFDIYKVIQKLKSTFNADLPIFIIISNKMKLFCMVTNDIIYEIKVIKYECKFYELYYYILNHQLKPAASC